MIIHLFPCFDNSPSVNKLKDYWFFCELSDAARLGKDDEILIKASSFTEENTSLQWLGDIALFDHKKKPVNIRAIAYEKFLLVEIKTKIEETTQHDLKREAGLELKPSEKYDAYETFDGKAVRILFTSKGFEEDKDRLLRMDTSALIKRAKRWIDEAPKIFFKEEALSDLWKHVWILHRTSTYHPEGIFQYPWESPCRWSTYQRPIIAMWDTLHIIEDLMYYDIDMAVQQLKNHFKLYRESDGMIAQDCVGNIEDLPGEKGLREPWKGRHFNISQPPLWAQTLWQIYLRTHDKDLLKWAFNLCVRNIEWWEKNRDQDGDGLFEYKDSVKGGGWESGYDKSPRFDDRTDEPFACIDLSSQMAMYYKYMSKIAHELGETVKEQLYKEKFERLASRIREKMWDPESEFFYDLNVRDDHWVKIKTIASFWPLIASVASKEQAEAMVKHLKSENEFWSPLPIPSVALDEPKFELDMWRGPVWISQNYWVLKGLVGYGYLETAAELTVSTLDMLSKVFQKDRRVYEFYDPYVGFVRRLRRKGKPSGPHPYYIGHMPLHALTYLGLYGIEALDEGLKIQPSRKHLRRRSKVSFNFGRTKVKLSIKNHGKDQIVEVSLNGELWRKLPLNRPVVIPFCEVFSQEELEIHLNFR